MYIKEIQILLVYLLIPMWRFFFGVATGAYLAQNYDIPIMSEWLTYAPKIFERD